MNNNDLYSMFLFCLFNLLISGKVLAMGDDNPLLTKLMVHQLEWRDNGSAIIEADAWLGFDLNKIWLKLDAEYDDDELEELELQLRYSRAISTYWDIQVGLQQHIQPHPSETWAVIGFYGLAPYFYEIDSAIYFNEHSETVLSLNAETEWMLTQRWLLSPQASVLINGYSDNERGVASGLAESTFGLRLHYEIRREIAPYIGWQWHKPWGKTADLAKQASTDSDRSQFVIGIKLWF